MLPNRAFLCMLVMALLSPLADAQQALRIQSLQRCGDLLVSEKQDWCLQVRALARSCPGCGSAMTPCPPRRCNAMVITDCP